MGALVGNFEKNPKRYKGPVLWAWLEIFFQKLRTGQGCFPFEEKFWLQFSKISSVLFIIFWKFRKIGQPGEVYRNFLKFLTGNFRFIWLSFRNIRKLFQEISVTFASVQKVPDFLVEWKAPQD